MNETDVALRIVIRQLRKEYFRVAYGNNLPEQWSWCVRFCKLNCTFERQCAAGIASKMKIGEVLRSFTVLRHLFKTASPVLETSHDLKCWADEAARVEGD